MAKSESKAFVCVCVSQRYAVFAASASSTEALALLSLTLLSAKNSRQLLLPLSDFFGHVCVCVCV